MSKTNRLIRKLTLAGLVMACFWASASSIRYFYVNSVPVAAEGECLKFKYPGDTLNYILKIVRNDDQAHMSHVTLITNTGPITIESEDEFTYGQIRSLNGKKVDCNEEAN